MVGTMAKIDDSVKKKVPELRFPGFTDDWEERKLSDIVVRLTKSSNNNQLPKVEFEDIIAGEGRLNKDISRKFDDRKGTLFEPDNILYGKLRPYLKNWLFSDFKGIALGDFWVFKSKNSEPKFVYSLIQADNYQRVANDTSGTKMPRSDWKKVSSSNFSIPTSLEEQQKIGSFFKQLDNTIALHQRKLDLLKEQKKGYLQKMFPKNGEKVPELRFAGFADDWEERKLGELGSVAMNRRIFKDQTSENEEVPFFKIGTFGSKPDAFISRELFEEYKLKYPYPEIGDILISASGSIGRTVVYQGEDEYFQDSNIVWLKHDNRLDNKFLKQFYSIVKWQGLEGSTIKRLYNKNILDTDISIPSTIEQNKIGMFFEQLDDTIALHQRKLDLLKEQKKGYLQKMFPKNGSKVPELRFAGFADDWEERKLSDIADRFDNLRVPITASDRKSGDTPYYGANGIQDYVEGFTHDGEFILVAEDGANDLKNYPVQYVNGKVWVNNHAHVLQGKKTITDNKFLMNSIKNFNIEPFLVGGGRAKLNADVMMKLNVLLPTFEEQEKIGSFFKQLDDTITLHQRKLDLLKEQKKGFLQKMFI